MADTGPVVFSPSSACVCIMQSDNVQLSIIVGMFRPATYSSQNLCLLRLALRHKLHGFHSRSTASDNDNVLVFDVLSIEFRRMKDLAFKSRSR